MLVLCGDRSIALFQQLVGFRDREIVADAMEVGQAFLLLYVDTLENDGMTHHFHVK